MLWFVLGLGVAAINMRSITRFVNTLVPGGEPIQRRVIVSYFMRYGLNLGLLLIAIQSGIRPALAAFAGLWVYRWVFLVNQQLSIRKQHKPYSA